jgi:hypothetical protein
MSSQALRSLSLALLVTVLYAALPTTALAQPRLVIDDVTVPFETDGGAGIATFNVSFADTTPHGSVTVFFSTTGGTATAGSQCSGTNADYVSVNSSALTFNSSEDSKQINITVCGDTRDESDETFLVNLFDPSGGTVLQDAQGQATLIDDDNPPSLRINDVTIDEGNSGVTNAVFTVTATGTSEQPINVAYATANRSGTGGSCGTAGADYATTSASLNFAAAQASQTLTIPVCGDAVGEQDEQFDVRLSSASNATIQDGTGLATIRNDDPMLSITPSVTVTEGDGGSQNAVFTVSIQGPSGNPVTVSFATANRTATGGTCGSGGADYGSSSGTLSFTAGQTSRTISVPVCGDIAFEQSEQFEVALSNASNASIQSGIGVVTIANNDPIVQDFGITQPRPSLPSLAPRLSITDQVSVTEPSTFTLIRNAVFTVSVTGAVTDPISVSYRTAPGSATGGTCGTTTKSAAGDYVTRTGTLTFTSTGPASQTIAVRICSDSRVESRETFTVTLSSPVNATISRATGTATIQD